MLLDYYAVLSRAVASLEENTTQVRQAVYERARHMLAERLAGTSPPLTEAQLRAEEIAFDDAVQRIEAELAHSPDRFAPAAQTAATAGQDEPAGDAPAAAAGAPPQSPRLMLLAGIVTVVVVGLFGLGYIAAINGFFARSGKAPAPAQKRAAIPQPGTASAVDPDVDLEPGFDGGASYSKLPFFYRRQPVYYRTVHPASTIVIDKSQHFLYLVQSNTVALRYGIAIGRECMAAHGLRLVARKEEWPAWRPSEIILSIREAVHGVPGGPGNPLGARLLDLDTASDRIHGTNAPASIGRDMLFGCVRLANDDIVDLYKRVAVGSRVIITN